MARPVLSTYRLQLRGADSGFAFTFADAENLLDYFDALGISHLYLSPIMTAVHGSTHGYDVVDPTTVSAELGGAPGLARLSAAARARGIGLIIDIVPNHVGVQRPEQNPWWWDVLKHGRSSRYAAFSTSIGASVTAESFCRYWDLMTMSRIWPSTASRCAWEIWCFRSRPEPAPAAAPKSTIDSTIVWSVGATAAVDTVASFRSRRWPACVKRIERSSTPGTSSWCAGSTPVLSMACGSITRTDCQIREGT